MAEKLVIGGFASTKKQIQTVAIKLSEHFDVDVEGLNFREALGKPRAFFDDQSLITHSGGMLPVAHSQPYDLIAVAPPVPERISKLLWRGWLMGRKLGQAEAAVTKFRDTSQFEALRYPQTHFGRLPEISQFNALEAAYHLGKRGVETTIVLMQNDGIFRYDHSVVHDEPSRPYRLISLEGEHVDFTNHPAEILGSMSVASQVRFKRKCEELYSSQGHLVAA